MTTIRGKEDNKARKLQYKENYPYTEEDGNSTNGFIKMDQIYKFPIEDIQDERKIYIVRKVKQIFFHKLRSCVEWYHNQNKIRKQIIKLK